MFAMVAWWRWRKDGAYLSLRLTRHLVGVHYVVRHPRFDRWVGFEPLIYYETWWKEAVAKVWYAGRITRDDRPRTGTGKEQ